MKIKEWIALGFIMVMATASRSLGAPEMGVLDHLEQTEQAARDIDANISKQVESLGTRWPEVEKFQSLLWKAMALDPTTPVNVPPNEVPKSLFAAQLNHELHVQLEELNRSPMPKENGAQAEYDSYKKTVSQIIDFRKARKFPEARAIAKRGTLDTHFAALMAKFTRPAGQKDETQKLVQRVLKELSKTRESWVNQNKDSDRKNFFGSNNQQFAWVMITMFLGFFLGIAAYRISPDFFQKFLDSTESVLPQASAAAAQSKLDYVRWLREFEDHLARLKTTQVGHERRIREVVGACEKITQQALSLYADPRIKGDANIEIRMSNLLREIQYQFEQGQKLAGGDRAQIQVMLEHCLRLCDAIETNSIQLDRAKLSEPPAMKSA